MIKNGLKLLNALGPVVIGNALAVLISIVFSPILSRLYSPDQFGILAVLTSYFSVLQVLSTMQFDTLIATVKTKRILRAVLTICLKLILIVSTSTAICIWITKYLSGSSKGVGGLGSWAFFLVPMLFTAGLARVATAWVLRIRSYRLIGRSVVITSAINTFTSLGLSSLGTSGLIWGALATPTMTAATQGKSVADYVAKVGLSSWRETRVVLSKFGNPCLVLTLSSLISVSSINLITPLYYSIFGSSFAGEYAMAVKVVGLPGVVLGTALAQYFTGEAGHIVRNNPRQMYGFLVSSVRRTALMGFLPFMVGITAPLYFAPLFGSKWKEAGVISAILATWAALQVVVTPAAAITYLIGKQRLQLALDLMRLCALIITFCYARFKHVSPLTMVSWFVATMCVIYIGTLVSYLRMARNYTSRFE